MSKNLNPGDVLPDFTLPATREQCGDCRNGRATAP